MDSALGAALVEAGSIGWPLWRSISAVPEGKQSNIGKYFARVKVFYFQHVAKVPTEQRFAPWHTKFTSYMSPNARIFESVFCTSSVYVLRLCQVSYVHTNVTRKILPRKSSYREKQEHPINTWGNTTRPWRAVWKTLSSRSHTNAVTAWKYIWWSQERRGSQILEPIISMRWLGYNVPTQSSLRIDVTSPVTSCESFPGSILLRREFQGRFCAFRQSRAVSAVCVK